MRRVPRFYVRIHAPRQAGLKRHATRAVGATVRLGYNLQRRWVDKIGPTVLIANQAQPSTLPGDRRFEFNVFGGVEGRAVGWNALLQHDTYTPRQLLPISRGVADLETGCQLATAACPTDFGGSGGLRNLTPDGGVDLAACS